MKSYKFGRAVAAVLACALAMSMLVVPCAFAVSTAEYDYDSASSVTGNFSGNGFWAGDDVAVTGTYERDVYAGAGNLVIDEAKVGSDVLAGAGDVAISRSTIGGSLRVGAGNVAVIDTQVGGNVNAGCQNYVQQVGSAVAGTVIVACESAQVMGACGSIMITADDVYINAVVEGDIDIDANTVRFGPSAKATGSIAVEARQAPSIDPAAELGPIDYTQAESNTDVSTAVAEAIAGILGALFVISLIIGIFGSLVCALLIELFFRRATAGASRMVKERTAPMLVTGLVGGIAAPFAFAIACAFFVTLPLAGAFLCVFIAIALMAVAFAGASLAKLVFPKMNRFVSALLGGLVLGIVSLIPILGNIVSICCIIYMLGYILQLIFLGMKKSDPAADATAEPGDEPTLAAPQVPQPPAADPIVPEKSALAVSEERASDVEPSSPAVEEQPEQAQPEPEQPDQAQPEPEQPEQAQPEQLAEPEPEEAKPEGQARD